MRPRPGASHAASLPLHGGVNPARALPRRVGRPRRRDAAALTRAIDAAITGLMLLAVIVTFTISSSMLTNWHIHYLTAGGNVVEKLHPASYATFLAALLLLMRDGDPVGELNRAFSEAKLLIVFLFCWLAMLTQMFVLERPFTMIIDTFLTPMVMCLVIWRLSPSQRRPLVWAIHLTMLLNIVLGYYEFVSGHRLVPLTLGDLVVLGEWRAAALLGHPLTASGIIAAYVMALVLRPALCPPFVVRVALIIFALGSLMAFGGRTALMTVLAVIGVFFLRKGFGLMRGSRAAPSAAIVAICLVFVIAAGAFAALYLGFFDKMLLRFSSDKGSAMARFATFDLLSHFDWHELILGPNPVRANALQNQLGLKYGIENFWISSIVQFGIIHAILLTIGLICLFAEILRRANPAAWAIAFLILMIAASSVSFSSKNIQIAQFVLLITLLLPRTARAAQPASAASSQPFHPGISHGHLRRPHPYRAARHGA